MIASWTTPPIDPNAPSSWRDRWEDILYLYPLAPVEVIVGLMHVAFGVPFMLPGVDVLRGGRIYRILHDAIPEIMIGSIALAIGAFMLYAVTNRAGRARRAAAFLSTIWWGALVITFILSAGLNNTAVGTYSVITLASMWLTWRWASPDPTRP